MHTSVVSHHRAWTNMRAVRHGTQYSVGAAPVQSGGVWYASGMTSTLCLQI